jgi:hypothetical protein
MTNEQPNYSLIMFFDIMVFLKVSFFSKEQPNFKVGD